MKKKKQIHCTCGSPADFYKKGKSHRVLVCSNCGIIATNPLPLAGIALSAGASLLSRKKKDKEDTVKKIVTDSLDKPNKGERYVQMVM